MPKIINLPLTDKVIAELKTGENVFLNGVIYAARDAAHKRIVEALENGKTTAVRAERADDILHGTDPGPSGTGNRFSRPDFKLPDGHLRAALDGRGLKG